KVEECRGLTQCAAAADRTSRVGEIGVVSLQLGKLHPRPGVSRATVRRYSSNEKKIKSLRGLGGASPCGRLACTTSLFVAARSWTAPARLPSAAMLPLQEAGSRPLAGSRGLPGARSMPPG